MNGENRLVLKTGEVKYTRNGGLNIDDVLIERQAIKTTVGVKENGKDAQELTVFYLYTKYIDKPVHELLKRKGSL